MFRMAVGHSDDVDLEAALTTVFEQCDAGLAGVAPRAGLLLTAWEPDPDLVLEAVRRRYPDVELAGSTTAGEMSSMLGFGEDSIVLVLFASDVVDITTGMGTNLLADPVGAARQAVAQARAHTTREPRLCIAMPTVARADAVQTLAALGTSLGPGVPIFGGGAAPEQLRDPGGTSRQFAGSASSEDGIAILLFSGPLSFSFGVETGWRAIGPRATVTRSSPLAVEQIDGGSAVEFYRRYVGPGEPPIANPLAVYETSSDKFYLRAPVGYDEATGAVRFFGGIPEGATIQLTVAATDEIFEGTRLSLEKAVEGFPSHVTIGGALVFSCAIRKFVLGTRAPREIAIARDLLGPTLPVAGFYCFGEIAPVPAEEGSRFHNETFVTVLLGSN